MGDTNKPNTNTSATTDNVLDNVSDISEGDIPDLPDAEDLDEPDDEDTVNGTAPNTDPVVQQQQPAEQQDESSLPAANSTVGNAAAVAGLAASYIAREEDIEEISDEEADWSDDFDPISFSEFEMDDGQQQQQNVWHFNGSGE